MSWWDSAGFSNLASQALKQAQKKIDKVLDIQEENNASSVTVSSPVSSTSSKKKTEATGDEFWNNWLAGDTVGASPPPVSQKKSSQNEVTSQYTLSKTMSVTESEKVASSVTETTVEVRSASEGMLTDNEVITVTKPKVSQSDFFESVGLTVTGDNLDVTHSDTKTMVDRKKKTLAGVSSNSIDRKGSPLKLVSRSKSKEKAESAGTSSVKDNVSATEEALKREKEAEEKMLQMLSCESQTNTKVEEESFVPAKQKDLCPDRGENLPEEVSTTSVPDADILDTDVSHETSKTDKTENNSTEPPQALASEPVSCCSELEASQKVDDSVHNPSDPQTVGVSEKLNAMADVDLMESSTCHWDDAGLLTDSQIVTDDIQPVEAESQKVQDADSVAAIENNAGSIEPELNELTVRDLTDTKNEMVSDNKWGGETDANVEETTLNPTGNIPEQNSDKMSMENHQTESNDTADLPDAVSVVSTLDESLTSETVDDLSSSNQTLTADDLQSLATSRTSDNDDMEVSENREAETGSKEEGDTKKIEDEPVMDVAKQDGTRVECEVSDLPSVHHPTHSEEVTETVQQSDSVQNNSNASIVTICQQSSQCEGGTTTASGQSMIASHSSQCSSSSYVKNMLEEAMVESVKDIDSRSDSHSSSDMVRIGSSQNSGHTSADELETATSSDIEIISHISTPTPNGDNRGFSVDRPFDLSPLRHALNKAVRRNSPPGHHRTDSGSSAYSLHSRNGDELTSPGDHRYTETEQQHRALMDRKTEETPANDPLEKEKLLKENPTSPPLQTITEGGELSQDTLCQDQNPDTNKLLEKLAEMAEILEARERKLVDLSRSNMDLMESNTILKNQLQQSEETREAEMTDLNQLTDEFTKRISDTEKRFQQAAKERDTLKKSLQEAEHSLAQRSDNTSAIEKMLREKDMQISELLTEGEKLSKQQLQSNNLMKKLRTKEKESEKLIKSQEKKLETQTEELERLQKVLDNKCDVEKKHSESINQLQLLVKTQEKELEKYKSESEDSQEKLRSAQTALDNSYREIAELHKATVRRASEVQERALSAELQSKQMLQKDMERFKVKSRQEQEALVNQIEDLQLSMSRMEKEHGRREDVLRQEISDLQQRLQEGEDRNQDLTDSVTAATRPLLRQIENLRSTYTAQSTSYEKVEKNLTDRLSEAQHQLAMAQEKERVATEQLLDVTAKLPSYESQLSTLRQDRSRLQAQLEMEKTKVEVLDDAKNKESAQREALQHSVESRLSELKKEKLLLENQLEMEKLKVEAEKKRLQLAHEQLREKELQLSQTKSRPTTPSDALKDSVDNVMLGSLASMSASSMSASFLSQPDEMERSFVMSPKANNLSLYESMRSTGAASLMENLQSQLKQKDGEILQLQNEIHELEHTRESMARELVSLTNEKHGLEEKAKELPDALNKYRELDQRNDALLQMYGEKVEEVQELRLDLQDMKELYKSQIQELLQKS